MLFTCLSKSKSDRNYYGKKSVLKENVIFNLGEMDIPEFNGLLAFLFFFFFFPNQRTNLYLARKINLKD